MDKREDSLVLQDVAEVESFGVWAGNMPDPPAPEEAGAGVSSFKYSSDGASDGLSSKAGSVLHKNPSPAPFAPAERMKAGVARTRAALAMNALKAKAEKRGKVAEHTEFLNSSASTGQLTEQQVQLLTKLRGVVTDRIKLAANYRGLLGFALYIGLYFFAVYTQRDTAITYDIEQSLLAQFVEPMQRTESSQAAKTPANGIYSFLRQTVLPVFDDAVCGNGICEPPGEYAGVQDNVGCSADCGAYEQASQFVVFLGDSRVPTGSTRAADPFLSWVDASELEPRYTWNAYSDNLAQWLFDTNQPIVGGSAQAVPFFVPDGNLTIRIFQENQLYGQAYSPLLISQFGPADPSTTLPVPEFQGFNYGDFTEAIAWNVGVRMQYAFQGDTSSDVNLQNFNVLEAGVTLPVSGMLLAADSQGQVLPVMEVPPCHWSKEQTFKHLNATGCTFGSFNGTCWNFTSMHAEWECPDSFTFEIRHHSLPGETAPKLRPKETPARHVQASNTLIGAVVITQRRWGEGSCASPSNWRQNLRERILGNMAALDNCKVGESTEPFGVDPTFLPASSLYNGRAEPSSFYTPDEFANGNVPYGFFPVSHLQPESIAGHDSEFNVYLDARMTTEQATRAVDYLEQGFYVDNLTQSVQITLLMYNPEKDAIADIILDIQLSEGGAVSTSFTIMSMALNEFFDTATTVAVALMVTTGAAIMVYGEFDELKDHWRRKRLLKYFTDLWNVIDWVAYISVPASLWTFLWLSKYLQETLTIADANGEMPHPLKNPKAEARLFEVDPAKEKLLIGIESNFRWYAEVLSIYAAWTAFNVLILMFRLFKVLDFQGRLGLITRTFNKSFSDMVHFIFLFIFVLVAFAVMGQKLYGRQLPQFKDFANCLMSLVRLTFAIGDDPYAKMLSANTMLQSFTAIYYLTFFFLSSVVLVNIFLAILLEAFGSVKENANNSESIFEGLATLARYDASLAQQQILKLMKAKSLGLRFMPDENLLYLLDAWIEAEKERGIQIEDSFGKSFKKQKKRRASWGGGGKQQEEDDQTRVVELPDGSQLSTLQLSALMLSLIAGAPEKVRKRKSKDVASKMSSSLFKSSQTASTASSNSQVAPEDALESATPEASPIASAHGAGASRRASAAELWWHSVRRGITDIQGHDRPAPGSPTGSEDAVINNLVSINTLQNQKLKGLVRSLMARYGKDLDEDQEDDKNLGFLKLEALQKQLDFYERYDKLEARFEAFMNQYGRDQEAVANLISRNRAELI